ncbi:GNAT family N-acetyltransferase [Novosphingobium sp. 1949]|uniref:GNAT family N-acetyltransferase n=1 Tax=Novosphingobium organovorum TaxID=2930092 RepID=A0ABT0BAH3_9SPHN|nr:GNAT family N-acetyltransferase [Novosphingobium organovorum]MCJ2182051.1 GNAT family N-acetyltransferase [Novosphingobium organovorum]
MARLSAVLGALTGDGGTSSFDPADVADGRAVMLLARDGHGAVIGCGAYRPLTPDAVDKAAEIKRMYAEQGCGAALLAALEQRAAERDGYTRLCLSTRRVNTRAIAFYERHGYRETAPYGRYVGRAQSICMEKRIG